MNSASRNKLVYVHKLDNEIIYVGSGTKQRVNTKSCRSEEHLKLWNSLEKIIVKDNLSETDAKTLESTLISQNLNNVNFLNKTQNVNQVLKLEWSFLDQYVYYDETSNTCLRWKIDHPEINKIRKDKQAGTLSGVYGRIRINGTLFQLHRVIWCLNNKRDINDGMVIDHVDRDKTNNKINNLREVDGSLNMRNKSHRKSNTGYQGIVEYPKDRYFVVQFSIQYRVNSTTSFSYGLNKSRAKTDWFETRELALEAAIKYRNSLITNGSIVLTTGS